jgi:hypothetical protein
MSELAFDALRAEIARQDEKHGPYEGTALGRSRLALATLEDETAEALMAWRAERRAASWDDTREELIQVAAVAMRALRDAFPNPRYDPVLPHPER